MGSRKRLPKYYGALAQLGARLTGSQEVTSSSLVRSTIEKPEDFNVFGLFLVSSDPSYYPKKEHIRSTNSKKILFLLSINCRKCLPDRVDPEPSGELDRVF